MDFARAPAFEVFFHLGKRTMRPGGVEMTRRMLAELDPGTQDDVVEFAPGVGATTRLVLPMKPASYTGVERNATAQGTVEKLLEGTNHRCVVGRAEAAGLDDGCASVLFGEAMLTMQTMATKVRIVQEAQRLLRDGGRYGIHETCLVPDDLDGDIKNEIEAALTEVLRVGARPLTVSEWRSLLEEAGFAIVSQHTAPMHLLEPRRLIQDEGLTGALRFISRVARNPAARKRIIATRKTLRRYAKRLMAVTIIAQKTS